MRHRPGWRILFVLYAAALFTGTHWPALAIGSPGTTRLDLYIHAAAFGVWTVLLTFCAFFGPTLSRRNRIRSLAVAAVYSVFDELSQGIPAIRRTVDVLDLVSNLTGVGLAGLALSAAAWWAGRDRPTPENP